VSGVRPAPLRAAGACPAEAKPDDPVLGHAGVDEFLGDAVFVPSHWTHRLPSMTSQCE